MIKIKEENIANKLYNSCMKFVHSIPNTSIGNIEKKKELIFSINDDFVKFKNKTMFFKSKRQNKNYYESEIRNEFIAYKNKVIEVLKEIKKIRNY